VPHSLRSIVRPSAAVVLVLVAGLVISGCAGTAADSAPVPVAAKPTPTPVPPALSATTGSISGNNSVVITGTGVGAATSVTFGGNASVALTVQSPNQITVTTPEATNFAVGPVPVVITTKTGPLATPAPLSFDYAVLTPVDKQMAYLMTYWTNRNIAEYGSLGGEDCVDFASQGLAARGWVQDSQWWHTQTNGVNHYGSVWISSTAMRDYFRAHPTYATALTDQQRDQVAVGDIVQFDWDNSGNRDHTGTVTKIVHEPGGHIDIYFAGHSNDSIFRSVDTAITVDHPGGTAYYWHLLK
jgi:hypothetical protein